MQIILLKSVPHVGKTGDIVVVKDGFARNYLLPQKLALRATRENKAFFESKKVEIELENQTSKIEALAVLGQLDNLVISLIRQAGEDGRLFGSVAARDITNALKEKNVEINRSVVFLESPIKNLGMFPVKLNLHADVVGVINVIVARTEGEALELEANFLKSKNVEAA